MNGDDLLTRATRALRDQPDASPNGAARTRARVMAAAVRDRKRRRVVAWAIPLAAVLAVSTAWADTHGWLAAMWHAVAPVAIAPNATTAPSSAPTTERAVESQSPSSTPTTSVPEVDVNDLPQASAPPTSTSTSTSTPTSTSTSTSGTAGPVPYGDAASASQGSLAPRFRVALRLLSHLGFSTGLEAGDVHGVRLPDGARSRTP